MAVPTLTEQLDNLFTTTWALRKEAVADNIFAATPFWFWMKDKGHIKPYEGGRFILTPLEYAKNDTVTWITKGGTVTLHDYEFLTEAKWDWRYLVASMVRFGVDDQQNRGKARVIDLMNAKFNNAQNSLIDAIETAMASSQSGNSMNGLQDLVADDPTSGTLGGIDSSTYTWWRNQTTNMTGKSADTYLVEYMKTMVNNCMASKGQERPDIIVTDQTTYEYYEGEVLEKLQIVNKKLADVGFDNLTFKGIPMVWSPALSKRMYFLNTKYLFLFYDPAMFFDMTEKPTKATTPSKTLSDLGEAPHMWN